MSRPKNFPETIYVGMTRQGEIRLIPTNDPVLFITTAGICKTMSYKICDFYCKIALKTSKPAPASAVIRKTYLDEYAATPIRKTCLDGTATLPEPDNQPSKATDALPKGLEASPELQQIVEEGLSKTKKRHRRTK